mgnify:CR=1 FL=1
MTEVLPNVDEGRQVDTGIALMLCRPWTDRPRSHVVQMRAQDLVSVEASFPRGAAGAMRFTTIRGPHNEFQKLLHAQASHETGSEEYSIAVMVYDPRRKVWVEPDNNRFIVDRWEDNIASDTNHITYTCRQEVVMLNKMVLGRHSGDWRLNNAYDEALEAYNEAERDYDSLIRQAENAAREVQQDRFGHTRGHRLYGYRGTDWIIRSRPGVARWGTLTVCHLRKRIMIYQPSTNRWLLLPEDRGSDTDTQRQRLIDLGNQIRPARQLLQRRRSALARAERAQRETSRGGTRFFYRRTPARTLATAWAEGGARDLERRWPPGPGVRRPRQAKGFWRDWTNTRDGKGNAWSRSTSTANWEFPLGIGFLDMVLDFQEKGEIDWTARGGRAFSIVPAGGLEVDQSRRVVLRLDTSVTEARESGDRSQHHSVTFVRTGDENRPGYFLTWGPNVATSGTPWGWHEASVSEPNADSRHSAAVLTRPEREKGHYREIRNSSRSITVGQHSPIPLVDFAPHHWISVYDHEDSLSKRIVDQIVIRQDGEGPLTADIQLGTRRQRQFTDVSRTLSRILGGIDHIQGHIPAAPGVSEPQIPTSATYSPPLSELSAALRHNFETGRPTVVIRASWAESELREPDDAGQGEDPADDPIDDGSDP